MRELKVGFAAGLALLAGSALAESTYDATLKGKRCSVSSNQQIDCDYRIGKDFWLSIAGVGQTDAAVTFMKADFDGGHYGTFGVMHGCAIVKPGKGKKAVGLIDLAFVSPRNGKVYRSWEECQAAQ